MSEIAALAKAKGFTDARVLDKVNARGELVIGVLIPPRHPGEWTAAKAEDGAGRSGADAREAPPDPREAKRLAMERRS